MKTHPIMEQALNFYNWEKAKKKADFEALRECQIEGEEYTKPPEIPKVEITINHNIWWKIFIRSLKP